VAVEQAALNAFPMMGLVLPTIYLVGKIAVKLVVMTGAWLGNKQTPLVLV